MKAETAPCGAEHDSFPSEGLGELRSHVADLSHLPLRKERTNNAQRCRKHRQKVRQQEQELYEENLQLKRERVDMLKRLAHLEYLVQALRGQESIDLTAENDLLREEIKKHRSYIDKVVEVTKMTPLDTAEDERARLMRNCVEGGIGHVIGLAYSSITESDLGWTRGVSSYMTLDPESETRTRLDVRYQFLPLGSTAGNAKRINLRLDIADFPFDWRLVVNFYHTTGREDEFIKKQYDKVNPKSKLEVHTLDTANIRDKELRSWKITTNRVGIRRDVVFVSSGKFVSVHPNAFPSNMRPKDLDVDEQMEVKAMVSCSCDLDCTSCETSTKGMLFKDGDKVGYSQFSDITSQARVNGFWEFGVEEDDFVCDDGTLNESFRYHMEQHWQKIYVHCKELSLSGSGPLL